MALLGINPSFWQNRPVLVTGHTGFKGSWLGLWLQHLGARVWGYALPPDTTPAMFEAARVADGMVHRVGDLRDLHALCDAVGDAKPDIVFHLGAQALVREGYIDPLGTVTSNVLGTAHLLEAVRRTASVRALVVVTSDKCYDNREWVWPYRETDPLGGHDPYSASKACAEILSAAWRDAFPREGLSIATVRAGNVIGGGDWAPDRLIPDFFRAQEIGGALQLRSPSAVRPWQHVLEPLTGYLTLAQRLCEEGEAFAEAWNFGPDESDTHPVSWLVDYLGSKVPGAVWQPDTRGHPHESHSLCLDSSKARQRLGWRPRWDLRMALDMTLAWHQAWQSGADMKGFSIDQIQRY